MKCSACQNNECEGKYENRHKCTGEKEEIECTCACHVTKAQAITRSAISIGSGIAVAGAGVALTVMTGGWFAIISGAALVGGGSSLVMNPIAKKIIGECMTVKDTTQDVLLGATIGAITGPIGAGGSAMAQGASGLAKFGFRMGAGAAAGGVSGTVSEAAKAIRGEEVSVGSFAKSITIGAVAGTVGGASTHIGSNVSKGVSNEVGKAVTRIGVQASSAAATDAGLQYYDKGEIDFKQTMLTTAGQLTVATTAEISQGMAQRSKAYNAKVNNERINEELEQKNVKNPEEVKAKLQSAIEAAHETPPKALDDTLKRTDVYKTHQQELLKIHNNPELTFAQKAELRGEYIRQHSLPEKNTMRIIKNKIYKSERVGDSNIHKLKGGRDGQYAIDIKSDTKGRGSERAILVDKNGKYVLAEFTTDHNYDGTKKEFDIYDPFDAIRPEHLNLDPLFGEDNPEDVEDKDDKKTK